MVKRGKIIIPANRRPWPHELHVTNLLATEGYVIHFLEESTIHSADITINGIAFEIKSPKSSNANSLEHLLKKAVKQSPNIIIDMSRMKNAHEKTVTSFLMTQAKSRKQIKRLLLITKHNQIIDISSLIR